MTAGTAANIHRIVARESASPVMTLKAIVAGSSAVLKDRYIGYLARVRRSGNDRMTIITAYGSMVAVSENSLEIILRLERPAIRSQFVADAA